MMLPVPMILTGIAIHNTTSAGIGVQLNWSITKAIKTIQRATIESKDPEMMTRYLPIQVSPNQPATGIRSNKDPLTICNSNCTTLVVGSRGMAANVKKKIVYDSVLHKNTSRVP